MRRVIGLLFALSLVSSYGETASRSLASPMFGWSHVFRVTEPLGSVVTSASPLPAAGWYTKEFFVNVANISPITQTFRVTFVLNGFSWSDSSGHFAKAILSGPVSQQTIQNGSAVNTTQFTNSSNWTTLTANSSTGTYFALYHLGSVASSENGGAVYANANIEVRIEVAEARGAVSAIAHTLSHCNGGCFLSNGPAATNDNMVLSILAQTPASLPFNGGRPF